MKSVQYIQISRPDQQRRLDNLLFSHYKNIPKSRIYRAIRKGEVRINGGRAQADTKLEACDTVRVPPFHQVFDANRAGVSRAPLQDATEKKLRQSLLYINKHIVVLNKPTGLVVHSGYRHQFSLSEGLAQLNIQDKDAMPLTPVHRLDKGTSGCLIFARHKTALYDLQSAFRQRQVDKTYLALVAGAWPRHCQRLEQTLSINQNTTPRYAYIEVKGKPSIGLFTIMKSYKQVSLIQVKPLTGRMHQIRVQTQSQQCPVLGDRLYTSPKQIELNQQLHIKRLCLHASQIRFYLAGDDYHFIAGLPDDLKSIMQSC